MIRRLIGRFILKCVGAHSQHFEDIFWRMVKDHERCAKRSDIADMRENIDSAKAKVMHELIHHVHGANGEVILPKEYEFLYGGDGQQIVREKR